MLLAIDAFRRKPETSDNNTVVRPTSVRSVFRKLKRLKVTEILPSIELRLDKLLSPQSVCELLPFAGTNRSGFTNRGKWVCGHPPSLVNISLESANLVIVGRFVGYSLMMTDFSRKSVWLVTHQSLTYLCTYFVVINAYSVYILNNFYK